MVSLIDIEALKEKKYNRMLRVALLRDCVNLANSSCNNIVIARKEIIFNLDIKVFYKISFGLDSFPRRS